MDNEDEKKSQVIEDSEMLRQMQAQYRKEQIASRRLELEIREHPDYTDYVIEAKPEPTLADVRKASEDRLKWQKLAEAQPSAGFSQDIEKLMKERPEMFDYPNITDLNVDPKYQAAMDKRMPDYMKKLTIVRQWKSQRKP